MAKGYRIYRGHLSRDFIRRCSVLVETESGSNMMYDVPHIKYHTDGDYSWGYAGAGPADLALSILVHLLDETLAWQPPEEQTSAQHVPENSRAYLLHQDFKNHFVVTLNEDDGWEIQEDEMADWLIARGISLS